MDSRQEIYEVTKEQVDEVKAELKKRGYKLPTLKTKKQREAFIEKYAYDPDIVINSTIQMKKVFRKNWKTRIPRLGGIEDGRADEEGEGSAGEEGV